ncbi:MAG: DUF2779 domain-containing protein [Candidatus Aenigmarchaeota archaeon]|nr:DUF2779 domain-containing protein [Candidatus Aenigmarchaeota archaeon]
MITLSKSRFKIGLACPKLLWCMFNSPDKVPPVDEATQAIFDQGHEVGDLAKKHYPGGVEVDWNKGFNYTLERTKELVKQRKTIFEASFKHKQAYCRVDVLVSDGEEWELVEVKSSSKVKDEHYWDVAFQLYCLEGAGIHVRRCHVMHINNEYVRQGAIDAQQLFVMQEVTKQVTELLPRIEEKIEEMVRIIKNPKMPLPALGTECVNPEKCPVCMKDLPEHNVTELYWIGKKAYPLINQGITRIADLPKDFKLNPKQKIQKNCILSEKPYIDSPAIKEFLKQIKYPIYLLDFETIQPAIPLFDKTRPFQHVPFQLSLHIIEKPRAKPEHIEFLAENADDPRTSIMNTLKTIGRIGTVLAYNMSFEKGVIEDIQELFPKEKWLHSLIDRMDDLLTPFKNFWYYNPKQHGSCSIKSVLPALTGKTYKHLEISKGDEAARKFLAMTYKSEKMDKGKLRKALLEYCKQDTEGMMEILIVLEDAISLYRSGT